MTYFDAIGGTHLIFQYGYFTIGADKPDPTSSCLPVWVAGIQPVFVIDGNIIGLAHSGIMRKYTDVFAGHIHFKDIMPGIICDQHIAPAIETYSVANAAP